MNPLLKVIKPLISFAKEIIRDSIQVTSKERAWDIYQTSFYKNAAYILLRSSAIAITGAVFWMVAARLYDPSDVGFAAAAISAAGLLVLFSHLGLDAAVIRFLPHSRSGNAMINSCLTVSGLASIVLALIFLGGIRIWSPALSFLQKDPIYFGLFIAFTISFSLLEFLARVYIAERRAEFSFTQGIIFGVVKLALLIFFAVFFQAFGIFSSWGIGAMVALGSGIFLFVPRIRKGYTPLPLIRREVINDIIHYSLKNYFVNLLSVAAGSFLPLMVVNILGAEANAFFYIGWSIASILSSIGVASASSLLAEGSYAKERLRLDSMRAIKFVAVLLVPAIFVIFLLGDKLLLLFGEVYSENATRILWTLAVAALPASLNFIYFSIKRIRMEMRRVIELSAFIAIAALGLSYFLMPWMGILGVGIAWLSAQGIATLIALPEIWALFSGAK